MEEANIATLVALPGDFRREEKKNVLHHFSLFHPRMASNSSDAFTGSTRSSDEYSLSVSLSLHRFVLTVSTQSSSVSCSRTCRYGSRGLRALLTKRNESIYTRRPTGAARSNDRRREGERERDTRNRSDFNRRPPFPTIFQFHLYRWEMRLPSFNQHLPNNNFS